MTLPFLLFLLLAGQLTEFANKTSRLSDKLIDKFKKNLAIIIPTPNPKILSVFSKKYFSSHMIKESANSRLLYITFGAGCMKTRFPLF